MNSSLDNVCGLLQLGYGDQFRLENIKQSLENGKVLYVSDNNYLIKLVHQYREEIKNAGEYKKPEPNIGGESKVSSSKIIPNENTPPKLEINEKQENPIFCINCGKKNPQGAKFCGGCGSSTNSPPPNSPPPNSPPPNSPPPNNYNQYQRPMQWKNESTVLLITVIFGIFGYGGIGHIYLGKIGKGIVLLIVGTILLVISVILLFMMMPFVIVLWIFAIWVVFNARSDCRKYNETMERTGRPPQ